MDDNAQTAPRLNLLAAALVLGVAGVHFQQYVSFMSHVPTIGVLFLLNAAGGAALAVALVARERLVRLGATLSSVGLVGGALISLIISMNGGLFGYQEPTWRTPVVIAVVLEIAVLPVLAALAAIGFRTPRAGITSRPTQP